MKITQQSYKAYRFKLLPNGQAQRSLSRFCGCVRFVYNNLLERINSEYETFCQTQDHQATLPLVKKPSISKFGLNYRIQELCRQYPWLKECHSQVLQQAAQDLAGAFGNFFRGTAKHPRFKKKYAHDAFRYPQGFEIDEANSRIRLPKIGWVRYINSLRKSRVGKNQCIEGTPRHITVIRQVDGWFVSIAARLLSPPAALVPVDAPVLGIDRGCVHAFTDSDGHFYDLPDSIRKLENRRKILQKQCSHKEKGSNNCRKFKRRVALISHRIAEIRRNFLNQTTATISKNHAMVAVEDLNTRAMTKSASRTREAPGRNVQQKRGLNRSILRNGWAEFVRQLRYKLATHGGLLLSVPAAYTSQTCPVCGYCCAGNRPRQDLFQCLRCGHACNADVNAAMNIKARAGLARIACEVNGAVRPSAAGTHRGALLAHA